MEDEAADPDAISPAGSSDCTHDSCLAKATVRRTRTQDRSTARVFFWARPSPETRQIAYPECSRNDCHRRADTPFDLYCQGDSGNAHFMPLAAPDASNGLSAAVALSAVLFAAAAGVSSAIIPSRVPLYAAAGLVGLILLALPLRYFASSRAAAAFGWVIMLAVAAVWRQGVLSPSAERWVVAALASLLLLPLAATTALDKEASENADDKATAPLLGVAVGLTVLVVVLEFDRVPNRSSLIHVISLAIVGLLALILLTAGVNGFIEGTEDASYSRKFSRPARGEPPSLNSRKDPPKPTASSAYSVRTQYALTVFAIRITRVLVYAAHAARIAAWFSWHAALDGAAWLRNGLVVCAHRIIETVVATAAHAVANIISAACVVGVAARAWAQSTLAAVVGLAGAAALSVVVCGWFQAYLTGSSLIFGLLTLVAGAAIPALLVSVWWALTKWSAKLVFSSALRSGGLAAATLFVGVLGAGWTADLPGLVFGIGRIRPGLLTIAGTAVLVAAALWLIVLKRRELNPE